MTDLAVKALPPDDLGQGHVLVTCPCSEVIDLMYEPGLTRDGIVPWKCGGCKTMLLVPVAGGGGDD
jgi:hypothetical protein